MRFYRGYSCGAIVIGARLQKEKGDKEVGNKGGIGGKEAVAPDRSEIPFRVAQYCDWLVERGSGEDGRTP